MLDAERCILCSRCVRFCDEITGTGELGIFHRGDQSLIGTFPGRQLDNPYSGNVVDICPVGALTDRDFRFQVRVWYLDTRNRSARAAPAAATSTSTAASGGLTITTAPGSPACKPALQPGGQQLVDLR